MQCYKRLLQLIFAKAEKICVVEHLLRSNELENPYYFWFNIYLVLRTACDVKPKGLQVRSSNIISVPRKVWQRSNLILISYIIY